MERQRYPACMADKQSSFPELKAALRHILILYYGFLKITFHAVCNTALSEWKHHAKF